MGAFGEERGSVCVCVKDVCEPMRWAQSSLSPLPRVFCMLGECSVAELHRSTEFTFTEKSPLPGLASYGLQSQITYPDPPNMLLMLY